jgi:hypothetical protein
LLHLALLFSLAMALWTGIAPTIARVDRAVLLSVVDTLSERRVPIESPFFANKMSLTRFYPDDSFRAAAPLDPNVAIDFKNF